MRCVLVNWLQKISRKVCLSLCSSPTRTLGGSIAVFRLLLLLRTKKKQKQNNKSPKATAAVLLFSSRLAFGSSITQSILLIRSMKTAAVPRYSVCLAFRLSVPRGQTPRTNIMNNLLQNDVLFSSASVIDSAPTFLLNAAETVCDQKIAIKTELKPEMIDF